MGKHNCATDNDGAHTWDFASKSGHGFGATACISIPRISKLVLSGEVEASAIAWWVYDHLPDWSGMEFFTTPSDIAFADEVTFNIGWHEKPMRAITSWQGGPRNLHSHMPDQESRRQSWIKLGAKEQSNNHPTEPNQDIGATIKILAQHKIEVNMRQLGKLNLGSPAGKLMLAMLAAVLQMGHLTKRKDRTAGYDTKKKVGGP